MSEHEGSNEALERAFDMIRVWHALHALAVPERVTFTYETPAGASRSAQTLKRNMTDADWIKRGNTGYTMQGIPLQMRVPADPDEGRFL